MNYISFVFNWANCLSPGAICAGQVLSFPVAVVEWDGGRYINFHGLRPELDFKELMTPTRLKVSPRSRMRELQRSIFSTPENIFTQFGGAGYGLYGLTISVAMTKERRIFNFLRKHAK
jgi:hypothetical protein